MIVATTGPVEQVQDFVVRVPGTWTLTPIPAADPCEITLDELLGRTTSGLDVAPTSTIPPAAQADAGVAPVWMFVGRVVPGGLEVGSPDGNRFVLDAVDLDLIDQLVEPSVASTLGLALDIEPDERLARVGRLVAAGCARPAADEEIPVAQRPRTRRPAPTAAEPEPITADPDQAAQGALTARLADAYRLSSKLRPVRRAVERLRAGWFR